MKFSPAFAVLIALFSLAIGPGVARANDIYIAQTAAGANNGQSCANAYAYTFFNTSSNWGSGSSQIGPGTTVHLCGTINNELTFQGSGTGGSPITLLFESGAQMSAAYWSGYLTGDAINADTRSYIAINGGTNGLITATANGTGLADQQAGGAIYLGSCQNCSVSNLTISNIYVHTAGVEDVAGENTYGICVYGGQGVTISNNTIHDTRWGILTIWSAGTYAGITINGNTIYNVDHGVGGGDNNSNVTVTGYSVYGNDIHDMLAWDTPNGDFHHNHVHIWSQNSGSTIHLSVYNNYFHGDWGASPTASINNEQNIIVTDFNNVMVNSHAAGAGANYGCISMGQGSGSLIANNTCIQNGSGIGFYVGGGGTGLTFENNTAQNVNGAITVNAAISGTVTMDHNNWYSIGGAGWSWPGYANVTFSSWQTGCGCDAHSSTGNPNLNNSYAPTSGSVLIQNGANLTALGITALDSDKAGALRPSGACISWPGANCWDIGAYQYGSGPQPPTDLTKTAVE